MFWHEVGMGRLEVLSSRDVFVLFDLNGRDREREWNKMDDVPNEEMTLNTFGRRRINW